MPDKTKSKTTPAAGNGADAFQGEPALYTVKSFAKAHGLNPSSVYRLWSRGEGPRSVRVLARRMIRAEDARAWREQLPDAPSLGKGR